MSGVRATPARRVFVTLAVLALAVLDLMNGTLLTVGLLVGSLVTCLLLRRALAGAAVASGLPPVDALAARAQSLADEQRRARADLEKLAKEHRTLTENLAAAIMIRASDGTLLYCSPFTEVLTGYSLAEIAATSDDFFLSIVHDEDRDRYVRALKVSSYGEPFQVRFRFVHKSGIEMWVESRTVPVLDEAGEVVASLSITLDVTGAVRYQRQVEEKNRDLQDFTYMVSHDLKAPIFTIKGMLTVVHEDMGAMLPDFAREPLDHIGRAAVRLEQLVSSVLEYARLAAQESVLEPVALSDLLREVANELTGQVEARHATLRIADDLPVVRGDKIKLYQIFTNLIVNALKYSSPARPPVVEIARTDTRLPRSAIVTVRDNGLGIPENRLKDIFRPFQRIHSTAAEGSGIGLASVKRLMEKLGGEVSVQSEVDSGTTFSLAFRTE